MLLGLRSLWEPQPTAPVTQSIAAMPQHKIEERKRRKQEDDEAIITSLIVEDLF